MKINLTRDAVDYLQNKKARKSKVRLAYNLKKKRRFKTTAAAVEQAAPSSPR